MLAARNRRGFAARAKQTGTNGTRQKKSNCSARFPPPAQATRAPAPVPSERGRAGSPAAAAGQRMLGGGGRPPRPACPPWPPLPALLRACRAAGRRRRRPPRPLSLSFLDRPPPALPQQRGPGRPAGRGAGSAAPVAAQGCGGQPPARPPRSPPPRAPSLAARDGGGLPAAGRAREPVAVWTACPGVQRPERPGARPGGSGAAAPGRPQR